MSDRSNDNSIEFESGSDRVTFTFSQPRFITKIQKLKKKHPDEFDFIVNEDGTIFGHMPVKFIKVGAPKQISEEQKEAFRERMAEKRSQRS